MSMERRFGGPGGAAVLALGALVVVLGFLIHRSSPLLPKCPVHETTGFHCPGCGVTRAARALLHGDPGAAFRFNPLVMTLVPLAAVAFLLRVPMGARTAWCVVGLVLVFGVLRNLPGWPFVLLAPP